MTMAIDKKESFTQNWNFCSNRLGLVSICCQTLSKVVCLSKNRSCSRRQFLGKLLNLIWKLNNFIGGAFLVSITSFEMTFKYFPRYINIIGDDQSMKVSSWGILLNTNWRHYQSVWPEKNSQMSVKVAQKWVH